MTSLDSFSLFPKLIPELRIHIWHHALRIPRLVFIWKHETRGAEYLRRSSASPLLSVSVESRREALRYYALPITGQCVLSLLPPPLCFHYPSHQAPKHVLQLQTQTPQQQQDNYQSLGNPCYIGPGTDIIYILGSDPAHKSPMSWKCAKILQDLDSPTPTFAPIRRLAVDELFLHSTPFFHHARMPHSIWKFVISDLRALEELYVVVSKDANPDAQRDALAICGSKGGKPAEWGKTEVEAKLREAKEGFREYMNCVWEEEADEEEIAKWSLPEVKVVTFEELVGRCWTSWE